MENKHFNL